MKSKPAPPPSPVSRDSDKLQLRLPDGMRERLGVEARKNNRSMNAEAVARLQDSFDPMKANVLVDLELLKRFNAVVETLERLEPGEVLVTAGEPSGLVKKKRKP